MDLLMLLAILGGIYVLLAFWHFPADWLFQSQKEALAKAKDHLVRARHCTVYTLLYVPLLLLLRTRVHEGIFDYGPNVETMLGYQFWASLAILWVSHFIIDTYWPVMMWAKYLRRAPQFKDVVKPVLLTPEQVEDLKTGKGIVRGVGWSDKEIDRITYKSDEDAFKAFFMTPVGAILCITMDQLFHLWFLWPVAWLVAN
jgi:hypothetical protein